MAAKRKPWARATMEKASAEEVEELLVFGYSCKLFRDDEKALYIERGKHLIPWMGDDRHMIDRYDGRGYLHDLEHFEAEPGQIPHEGLTDEEIKVESLCDEERYMALYKDMSEEELYHEEEMKRLRMALASDGAYNEVNFTYGEESGLKDSYDPAEATSNDAVEVPEEEPFIAPPELDVPEGMELPPTEKMNAIVEKTANFVAQHGLQMEIVIKTKQAKNQQLLFMQFDHPLNPYYKHLIQCIKQGKYRPATQDKGSKDGENGEEEEDDDDDDDGDGNYLHPSLMASKSTSVSTTALSYSTGSYLDGYGYPSNSLLNSGTVPYAPRNHGDDWYSLLVKQLKDKVSKNQGTSQSPMSVTPPVGMGSPNSTPVVESGNVASSAVQSGQYSMYAVADPSLPTPPGLEPVTLPQSKQDQPLQSSGMEAEALAHGSTSSLADSSEHSSVRVTSNYLLRESHILPPTPDVQPIVDKMAAYVAKNGKDFETVVLNKGDKRFEFLHPWHEFHPYYLFKKSVYDLQMRKGGRTDDSAEADHLSAPVSFSIKSKDPDVAPLEKRNAFALDESSDSDVDGEKKELKNEDADKRDEAKEKVEKNEKLQDHHAALVLEKIISEDGHAQATEKPPRKVKAESIDSRKAKADSLELRLAEDKLKDRLAAAAREKLSSASREKQLQQERKRRAALFLTLLKKDPNQAEELPNFPIIGPQLPGARMSDFANLDDDLHHSDGSRSSVDKMPWTSSEKQRTSNSSRTASPDRFSKFSDKGATSRNQKSRSRSRSPSHGRKRRTHHRSRSRSRPRTSKHRRSRSRSRSKVSKGKTPPAAYAIVRRSHSPSPHRPDYRSRSRSRDHVHKRHHQSAPFQGRRDYHWHHGRKSRSPSHHRSWRSRSRSKSHNRQTSSPKSHRSRSRSPSRHSHSKGKSKKSKRASSPSSPETHQEPAKETSRSVTPQPPGIEITVETIVDGS